MKFSKAVFAPAFLMLAGCATYPYQTAFDACDYQAGACYRYCEDVAADPREYAACHQDCDARANQCFADAYDSYSYASSTYAGAYYAPSWPWYGRYSAWGPSSGYYFDFTYWSSGRYSRPRYRDRYDYDRRDRRHGYDRRKDDHHGRSDGGGRDHDRRDRHKGDRNRPRGAQGRAGAPPQAAPQQRPPRPTGAQPGGAKPQAAPPPQRPARPTGGPNPRRNSQPATRQAPANPPAPASQPSAQPSAQPAPAAAPQSAPARRAPRRTPKRPDDLIDELRDKQ